VELILRAAPLHDVGKIGITDAILLKPDKLSEQEFATMKQHTTIGGRMLSGSSSPWLQLAEEIALTHHERWDGKGYPSGLRGENIALMGRIVAVADVFDALTHERPYKKAWSIKEAVAEIERQSGGQFDPACGSGFPGVTSMRLRSADDKKKAPDDFHPVPLLSSPTGRPLQRAAWLALV
jgi:putative two-component system response regulator